MGFRPDAWREVIEIRLCPHCAKGEVRLRERELWGYLEEGWDFEKDEPEDFLLAFPVRWVHTCNTCDWKMVFNIDPDREHFQIRQRLKDNDVGGHRTRYEKELEGLRERSRPRRGLGYALS